MTRTYSRRDLTWRDREVYLRGGRTPLAAITYDEAWPLWRVRMPDRTLSDLLNLTRARDAAVTIALAQLNREAAPPMRPKNAPMARAAASMRTSGGVRP